jgi:nicotinamidase-related amidase
MTKLSGARTALVLIDVINHFEFPGGDQLLAHAEPTVKPLLALRRAAHAARAPVIYANDNFGDWHSDSNRILRRCRRRGCPGARFTRSLAPLGRDYFVLKPANSAFYSTTLETMLRALKVRALILAGLSAENCVLFTAHDAYLRGFRLHVPEDCVASEKSADARKALEQMQHTLKANIAPSHSLHFSPRPAASDVAQHMQARKLTPS